MWPHMLVTILGLWLMASPEVVGLHRPAATSAWIVGPIVATFATVAWWGTTRVVRWWNMPAALWLLLAPWTIDHSTTAAINSLLCGALIACLSAVRGSIRHDFAGGWSALWGRRA